MYRFKLPLRGTKKKFKESLEVKIIFYASIKEEDTLTSDSFIDLLDRVKDLIDIGIKRQI